MREITCTAITDAVARMCVEAACDLPADVEDAVRGALDAEESPYGTWALEKICGNIETARSEGVPLCQDTGLALVHARVGQDVRITGGTLQEAVDAGVARGYGEGLLRMSTVRDPLFDRTNTGDNTPAILDIELVEGDSLELDLLEKGAGSENMSRLGMLTPADGTDGVRRFVVDAVTAAGGNPCPPTIVGVGVGSNAEGALRLSKKALRRELGTPNPDERYARLETDILDELNASGIGPQGFGGRVTSLAVHIEAAPTHIAMLPVAVTLNCHAARRAHVEL